MDKKLQGKLYKRYPELFRQRKLPMNKTAMCWNFQHGDGWFNLLGFMCQWIDWNMKKNSHCYPQIEFNTIKEKFGQLRVYIDVPKCSKEQQSGLDEIRGVISFVQAMSGHVCEICGKAGKTRCIDKWYKTRCDEHSKERRKR